MLRYHVHHYNGEKGGVLANAAKIFLFSLSAPYNNPAVWFAKDF